jgi:hypothetical protein
VVEKILTERALERQPPPKGRARKAAQPGQRFAARAASAFNDTSP